MFKSSLKVFGQCVVGTDSRHLLTIKINKSNLHNSHQLLTLHKYLKTSFVNVTVIHI